MKRGITICGTDPFMEFYSEAYPAMKAGCDKLMTVDGVGGLAGGLKTQMDLDSQEPVDPLSSKPWKPKCDDIEVVLQALPMPVGCKSILNAK